MVIAVTTFPLFSPIVWIINKVFETLFPATADSEQRMRAVLGSLTQRLRAMFGTTSKAPDSRGTEP
jgi:hypothetical protein